MLKGTLRAEYIRCGKAGCACARDPEKRHGPYWYLTWWEDGKRRKRYIPAVKLPEVQAQVAVRRRCVERRREVDAYVRQVKADLAAPPPSEPAVQVVNKPVSKLTAEEAWAKLCAKLQQAS